MGTHIFPGRGPYHQVPLPEAPYKVDVFLAAAFEWHTGVKLIQDFVNGLLGCGTGLFCTTFFLRLLFFLEFVYRPLLFHANTPGLFGGRGEMAMAVP